MDESEPILDRVIEACRNLVLHGVSRQDLQDYGELRFV